MPSFGLSVSTDATGNVFWTGNFNDYFITFGTDTLSNSHPGYDDIFLVKFDALGNVLWDKSVGGFYDDVGYDVPTFFGGRSYKTPNLDYMAANGMTFSHFYSQPDGFPSRLQAFTGKFNYRKI